MAVGGDRGECIKFHLQHTGRDLVRQESGPPHPMPGGQGWRRSLPGMITSIGEYARLLTGVTIPKSVTRIEDSTFQSCTSLTGTTLFDNAPSMGTGVFDLNAAAASI